MTEFTGFSVESPANYEQKCLCVLVLDVSYSMKGDPIDELNRGLQDFYSEIKADSTAASRLEIAILTFSDRVDIIQTPKLVSNFTMPILTVSGTTKMADGVRKAIDMVEARKDWYRETGQPYYRPWIILMTDGEPDRDQDIDELADRIRESTTPSRGTAGRKFIFFAVGVGDANMEILNRISAQTMPPAKMRGLKFSSFFKWLSASMTTVTHSREGETVVIPSPADWMTGFTIS